MHQRHGAQSIARDGRGLTNLDVHGGRQQTWTVGASYSPVLPLRFLAEFLHGDVAGGPSPRTVNAFASRLIIQF